jgi:hypothetical protein
VRAIEYTVGIFCLIGFVGKPLIRIQVDKIKNDVSLIWSGISEYFSAVLTPDASKYIPWATNLKS